MLTADDVLTTKVLLLGVAAKKEYKISLSS